MRPHIGSGLGRAIRQYSVALGFVLGQIAPLPTTPARQPTEIVRMEPSDGDTLGFDPRERATRQHILTVPYMLSDASVDVMVLPGSSARREPDWLRKN